MKKETLNAAASRAPRRPTGRDVAAALGVSAKTVSNAYRAPDQLSAGLRERVLATAARLGYAGPDPVASGLRRGRVGALGVLYANRLSYAFEDPAIRDLLAGMTRVAESAGAGLLLLPGSADLEQRTAAITGAVVDGVLAVSLADREPALEAALARRLPLVVVDQPRPAQLGPDIPWIGVDDRAAAAEVAEHLLALGHRRFAVVSFGVERDPVRGLIDVNRQEHGELAVTRDRLAGYREALGRHELDWRQVPVFQGTDSTPAEGEAGAQAVLDSNPTALICLSDRLAEGALRAIARRRLRVPQDLSVVGFDNSLPAFGLTTVQQPQREKGERAAHALLALLRGETVASPPPLATQLIVRGSTAPPRRQAARSTSAG
jgi:DNA-binding LacI/PurR family transcriptional regulator